MQFRIDHIYHFTEVFHIGFKINIIGIDDEQAAFFVARNPVFVAFVEMFEIIQAHVALIIAAPRLDVRHQRGNAGAEIDEQVGRLYLRGHGVEQVEIIVEIAGRHQAHVVEVGRKNVGILVDGAVLNDSAIALKDFQNLPIPAVEEENLKIERPAVHVVVKITQVGIVVGAFVVYLPTELLAQLGAQRGFARADIAGDGDVFYFGMSGCVC